jgi:hypothetical protein
MHFPRPKLVCYTLLKEKKIKQKLSEGRAKDAAIGGVRMEDMKPQGVSIRVCRGNGCPVLAQHVGGSVLISVPQRRIN